MPSNSAGERAPSGLGYCSAFLPVCVRFLQLLLFQEEELLLSSLDVTAVAICIEYSKRPWLNIERMKEIAKNQAVHLKLSFARADLLQSWCVSLTKKIICPSQSLLSITHLFHKLKDLNSTVSSRLLLQFYDVRIIVFFPLVWMLSVFIPFDSIFLFSF